ncbi:MAG: FtsX-like permease family protein [Candidatus Marinimicrobia bacterium]|jgi:ABC-type lipoprotein release transport system permease subunit|nr:FtsX-like permease family protein [Candidatus Neomarinimicrobiota bacterium]|tara:strand:+ start:1101 stop:2282 length:1182 start_codon:yes stop_codon:yes gene_type:complete
MLFKIAIKNLLGAKLRTWLNVFVTALSFFMIILFSAMYDGMREHAKQVTIDTEIAGGAYWHPEYDPMDPMTFEDAHSIIPRDIKLLVDQKKAVPVLVSQASIYPNGRIMPVIMKGISSEQNIVNMPTDALSGHEEIAIPVLIGKGMASDTKLKVGDGFTIRWLDADRTYDADEGTVVHIMDTENFKLDMGHIWIPLKKAQTMLAMEEEATYVTYAEGLSIIENRDDWIPRDVKYLIRDMEALIKADEPNAAIMYIILLCFAAMGIFNAQVLSIFRRGREIGTLMALGMTRTRVVGLFTLEGGLNAFLAAIMTVILFGPLLWYFGNNGIWLGVDYSDGAMGIIVEKYLIPVYSVGLVVTTTIVVSIIVLIVSYMPSRRIARMKPTDALRGKVTV